MASYGSNIKRQKTTATTISIKEGAVPRTSYSSEANNESSVLNRIEHKPDGGVEDLLSYRYYNPSEKVYGRPLEDWLRPSVSFDHAFGDTDNQQRRKEENLLPDTIELHKKKLKTTFEFCTKLGVKLWSISDTNLLPRYYDGEDTNVLEEILDYVLELQARTNIKPLLIEVDLTSDPKYANGSLTTQDASLTSIVGGQLKRGLDIALKLGADNVLIRNKTDGFNSLLETDLTRELRNYSRFLKMTAEYREHIGYKGQLLLEPARKTSIRSGENEIFYNYTNDLFSTICFLKNYGLERLFKLNVTPEINGIFTLLYGSLGSVRITNKELRPKRTVLFFKHIIEHGGFQHGGINLSLTPLNNSTDIKDLFLLYINQIDKLSRALRIAVRVIQDGVATRSLQRKYLSFHTGWGSRFSSGEASLEDCEEQTRRSGSYQNNPVQNQNSDFVLDRYLQSK